MIYLKILNAKRKSLRYYLFLLDWLRSIDILTRLNVLLVFQGEFFVVDLELLILFSDGLVLVGELRIQIFQLPNLVLVLLLEDSVLTLTVVNLKTELFDFLASLLELFADSLVLLFEELAFLLELLQQGLGLFRERDLLGELLLPLRPLRGQSLNFGFQRLDQLIGTLELFSEVLNFFELRVFLVDLVLEGLDFRLQLLRLRLELKFFFGYGPQGLQLRVLGLVVFFKHVVLLGELVTFYCASLSLFV